MCVGAGRGDECAGANATSCHIGLACMKDEPSEDDDDDDEEDDDDDEDSNGHHHKHDKEKKKKKTGYSCAP